MTRLLGVDTGGTFTDFVFEADGRVYVHKVLSTPSAPEDAIVQGVTELGIPNDDLQLVHGSTVATNAVLEGRGVRTAFITNRGFADLLALARQARSELYNLQPPPMPSPVPPDLCLETGGRLAADGSVVDPLTEADLAALTDALERLAPEAVAINLLFSFVDERFENAIAQAVPEPMFVSRSARVLPEYREYERGVTTWLNAYVGPLVQGYLRRLGERLAPASVWVMHSAGGTMSADQAGANAVRLLLSGPAGGLMGARFAGRASDRERLLSFDMGGTSTDVALIDGEVQLTTEGRIGPYPVGVPQVDMHTIGAGGGSIASVDAGGVLLVGPHSAGAQPGPACYGQGGTRPTVTDANVVLGRLLPEAFLGGELALDTAAARTALGGLARCLGRSVEETAEGVIEVANEHMAQALRVISVQRGIDPRAFTLLSFGGAGGLHVCALAEALGMEEALIPVHAGVLSALGMLTAPRARELSRTVQGPLEAFSGAALERYWDPLRREGRTELQAEGLALEDIREHPALDLRYQGQSYTLTVAWQGIERSEAAFHEAHAQRFGHRLDLPVELVNLRLRLAGPPPAFELPPLPGGTGRPKPQGHAPVYGVGDRVAVYAREVLRAGEAFDGPALVPERLATAFVPAGWQCRVDERGNLLLMRG